METVRANGLDVGYEVHGAGPPLIMLHGATSSGREDFAAQVPLFSKAFQVFLPDARGHAMFLDLLMKPVCFTTSIC